MVREPLCTRDTPAPDTPAPAAPLPTMLALSSAEFVAGFVPPDYPRVGWLQRRFLYSLIAATGDGKTAIALLVALRVSQGFKPLHYSANHQLSTLGVRGAFLYVASVMVSGGSPAGHVRPCFDNRVI